MLYIKYIYISCGPEGHILNKAELLMANSPWLARTINMVPKGQFMHNPPLPLARNIFQGRKPVSSIGILEYTSCGSHGYREIYSLRFFLPLEVYDQAQVGPVRTSGALLAGFM